MMHGAARSWYNCPFRVEPAIWKPITIPTRAAVPETNRSLGGAIDQLESSEAKSGPLGTPAPPLLGHFFSGSLQRSRGPWLLERRGPTKQASRGAGVGPLGFEPPPWASFGQADWLGRAFGVHGARGSSFAMLLLARHL